MTKIDTFYDVIISLSILSFLFYFRIANNSQNNIFLVYIKFLSDVVYITVVVKAANTSEVR
jgi:hypothetical protein